MIGDLQVIYNISPKYKIVVGSKNIGNHTNMSYGPYIGRTAYMEINTKIERKEKNKLVLIKRKKTTKKMKTKVLFLAMLQTVQILKVSIKR